MNAKFAEWLENIYIDYLFWAIDQRFKNRNDEYEKMAEWFNQHMYDYGEIPSQSDDIKQMKIGGINNAILQDEALNSYMKESDLDKAANEHSKLAFNGLIVIDNIEAFKAGAQWQLNKLLEESISCKVFWHDGPLLDYTQEQQDNALERIGAGVDDKVKLIILKDNEKCTQDS